MGMISKFKHITVCINITNMLKDNFCDCRPKKLFIGKTNLFGSQKNCMYRYNQTLQFCIHNHLWCTKKTFLYNKILHFTLIFSAYLGLSKCTIYLYTLCKNNILESKIILH